MKNLDHLTPLTTDILGCAFEVRKYIGKGFRENFYEKALGYELSRLGYHVEHQVPISAMYKGIEIDNAYKVDIIVENKILIEVKAKSETIPEHIRQLTTYMQLGTYDLGYLMNFGANDFSVGRTLDIDKDKGIFRIIRSERRR